jgi:hypothetical protein
MNDCVKVRTISLGMLRVCFCVSSMRLGVPFIAPRQLGAIGGQQGRSKLPSVGWHIGQSGAPPDNHCSCPVRDLLPILAHTTIADLWQLAHQTLSGAHRTVRCPLLDLTVWAVLFWVAQARPKKTGSKHGLTRNILGRANTTRIQGWAGL